MSNFFEELKRRKVYRTAVAYAAVSFAIMQIVEIIFPMFEIPLWMGRFVIIVIVLCISRHLYAFPDTCMRFQTLYGHYKLAATKLAAAGVFFPAELTSLDF